MGTVPRFETCVSVFSAPHWSTQWINLFGEWFKRIESPRLDESNPMDSSSLA